MTNSIESIINPNSIAVIGATNRPGSVGRAVFSNLLSSGYQGVLYPVNPNTRYVNSVKAYPRLTDVQDEIDLAIIIVPSEMVPSIVEEAAEKKVKGLIVMSAGFKEIGGRGRELESRLTRLVKENGLKMVGPNCLGVINTSDNVRMNASFSRKMPRAGNIAFISQSGALCAAILDFAEARHIGFSKFISFGNKADVNEIDLLRYLEHDPYTNVILMYLEDITNGREFIEVARHIAWQTKKPMIALKSGRSPEGAQAAASHTGSLAGMDMAYDAIFLQSGIQRVEVVNELFDYAIAYANQPIPAGNRIAIVTNAGGPGIIATDSAIRHGLSLSTLSERTRAELAKQLPEAASTKNPVDVIGDATHERYESAIRTILLDEQVDGAVVILTPQAMTDVLGTAQIVPHVTKGINKPVLCSFMGVMDVSEGIRHLEENGIPNYSFPEDAIRTMASMANFGRIQRYKRMSLKEYPVERDKAAAVIKEKLADMESCLMPEYEANEILNCYGFPLLPGRMIKDSDMIEPAARKIGMPVAMKISSPDIVHKFDAGGVRLNVKTVEDAKRAYDEIIENVKSFKPDADIQGVHMERMAGDGLEVILGAFRDPKFGPICMFGLGGVFVESIRDVSFRLAPMWEISAEIMISSIKSYTILKGIRGNPPSDIEAIKECLLRLSQLVSDHPEIAEIDINPMMVYPEGQGCAVTDSRILLRRVTA